MPHFIKIDDKEDFAWLKRQIERWASQARDNPGAYCDHIEKFENLLAAFENAKVAESVQVIEGAKPLEEPKPQRKPRGSQKIFDPNLCEEHPKYGAKRPPRTECEGCWDAYEKYAGKAAANLARRKQKTKQALANR